VAAVLEVNNRVGPSGSYGQASYKVRMPRRGIRGKGSARLIWMLSLHPMNVKENIPVDVLRKIRKEVEDG
jgi:hypothetical protein